MTTELPTDRENLEWLLEAFVSRVRGTTFALLFSTDGMKKAASGLGVDDADTMSGAMASLYALGKGAGRVGGHVGSVRHVAIEHDNFVLFVMEAGSGSLLAVQATRDADPSVVGYEMTTLVKSVASHLATAARENTAADAGQ